MRTMRRTTCFPRRAPARISPPARSSQAPYASCILDGRRRRNPIDLLRRLGRSFPFEELERFQTLTDDGLLSGFIRCLLNVAVKLIGSPREYEYIHIRREEV